MPPPRVIVGALCQGLIDALRAEAVARDAELAARAAVADFLEASLPEWMRRFPEELCWVWLAPETPDAIEVFGASPMPRGDVERERTNALFFEVATSLHLAGFVHVRLHAHPAERFLSCACVWRTP